MNTDIKQTIETLALPLIEAQGLELWGLDIVAGPQLKVCLYIDGPANAEKDISATIDQCEAISRQLGLALDVEDCIDQPWVLEVSSPGLERRFFSLGQMAAYVGDPVEVKLLEPLAGRKLWRGRLMTVGAGDISIQPCAISDTGEIREEKNEPVILKWDNVAKAKRLYVFAMPQKPGKPSAKKPSKK